ncbi:hypothetical protein [Sphingobium lignivorans]|uniref:hypothetical protein n=1 Tax=Sphingobium lignivorans TaxID=2735886 RepID=UPI00161D15AA|nr:hypothetical protein [Sphingobium lignivorans]
MIGHKRVDIAAISIVQHCFIEVRKSFFLVLRAWIDAFLSSSVPISLWFAFDGEDRDNTQSRQCNYSPVYDHGGFLM